LRHDALHSKVRFACGSDDSSQIAACQQGELSCGWIMRRQTKSNQMHFDGMRISPAPENNIDLLESREPKTQSPGVETSMGAIIHHMLDAAPAPVAPFSHAVEVDGWVFVTGQIPENPDHENEPLPVGIEAQTRRVMDNLRLVLAGIGMGLEHVVSARVFIIDMREFEIMNKIYASYFPANKRPARTCIGVTGLAKGARVEIDFIARRP
jgi:reactive intermediate/imine deaminase